MRGLEALGQRLEAGIGAVEAQTASRPRAALLGVALALTTTLGGLAGLFLLLKLLTAIF